MVFKDLGADIFTLVKQYKTLNSLTVQQTRDLGGLLDEINDYKSNGLLIGEDYDRFLKQIQSLNSDNLTYYFQSVAEGAENARVNIVDAYAAILDGNTHGLKNVQSIMNTFNNSFDGSVEKQKEFTKAVGQSNKGLANYLNSIEAGGTATLKGYAGQLVKTTAKTVLLTAKTIALQAAISIGLSVAINGIIALTNKLVNREKELIEKAKESSEKNDEQAKSLDELKEKYKEICDSADDEKTKNEELNEIKIELINTYKIEKENLEELNLEREKGLELLDEEFKKSKRNSQNVWLDRNKEIVNKANQEMASSGVDYFSAYLSENNISDSILKLFNKREAFGDTGYVNLEFDYTDTVDRLNKLKNIYNEILDIQSKRSLTADEQQLLSDVKTTLDAIQGVYDKYYDTYSKAAKYNVENIVENYLNTDEGKIENVGKDTFNSWSKGLLDQAKNAEQKRQLENYIEEAFPDLTKYFENLAKARQKFAQPLSANQYEAAWAKEKDNFLESLSPEDLEASLNIPDLFADGLDGATAKIEAWKADPNNTVTAETDTSSLDDLQKAYDELSKSASNYTKNQKSITSALEEQEKYGQLSASTIQELTEAGYAQALVIDSETGAVTLNKQAYEQLNREKKTAIKLEAEQQKSDLSQKYNDESKAVSDLTLEMQYANAERRKAISLEISQHYQNMAEYLDMIDKINSSTASLDAPSFEDGKEEKPQSVLDFEEEYARRQHEINMGRMKEDEDYYKWLESAAKTAFEGLEDYQDDLWKYEEEVYKGRKQLAEDYFNEQQKLFENRISNLEDYLEKFKDGKVTTFVEQSDIDALDELNKQMKELYEVGNVDLTKRPKVSAETMRKAGYDVADGSTATVYSTMEFLWQGDEENGKYVAVHYTPILPDGTVLDEKTLHDYIYGTLAGSQDILNADAENLGIVLKVDTGFNISEEDMKSLETGNYTDNIQNIIKACDDWSVSLHDIQAEWMVLDEKVKNIQPLTIEEKYDYIRSSYQEILSEIDRRRNEIIQSGIKGHEDDLKALEQQYEKYVKEMADIFKDEVESEIDYIQDLQDTVEKAYDDEIDKIEAEKKAMEDRYDAEIDKIDDIIDSLESKNKSEKLTNDLIKARQDLEKANRNKRLVFDSMGNQSYVADTQAVSEAQQAVKEAEQAITVNKLEEVKKAIEDEKTVLSQSYDNQLTELKEQKEQQKTFYDNLIKALQDYINPNKQTESNTNVWNTVAGEDGAVKVGNSEMSTSYIDSRISSEDAVKKIYAKMLENSAWSDTDIDKALKDYDITKLLTALTSNNYKALGANHVLAGSSVTNAQSYVNNNSKQSVTISIGDVNITNPVGDTINLAKEITKQLPNAVIQEIYRNR